MTKAKKPSRKPEKTEETSITNENITEIKVDDNEDDNIKELLKKKDEEISHLTREIKNQLVMIKDLQTKIDRFDKPNKSLEEKRTEKQPPMMIKEDKGPEGLRTVMGILMGLSFHLYFMLWNIQLFRINALFIFSAFSFFVGTILTFSEYCNVRKIPRYLLIIGSVGLLVNIMNVIFLRFQVGVSTQDIDLLGTILIFPFVIGIVAILILLENKFKFSKRF